jgi:hypothetical protein
MKVLDQLKRMKKDDLVKMADELGVKGITHSNRLDLAKKILLKQKQNELNQESEPVIVPELEGPQRKPEFEALIGEEPSEMPEVGPELSQEPKDGRGGYREGAGRPPGLTDEKARAQRVLKNEVPDPAIEFVVECIFGLTGEGKPKKIVPTTKMIALPVTNLLSYYFPNLHISPVLQSWFDLGIGIKNLVVSRIEAARSEPVVESGETEDNGKRGPD